MEETLANVPNAGVMNSLEKIYRRKIFSQIVNSLLISCAIFIAAVTLCSLLQLIFDFNTAGRAILLFVILLAAFAPIIAFLLPSLVRLVRGPGIEDVKEIALEAGNAFPELKDRLRNAIELMSEEAQPEAQNYNKYHSQELARAYVAQIFAKASHHDIAGALRYRSSAKAKLACSISFVTGLLLFLLLPTQLPPAFAEIINFTKKNPSAYTIQVSPGDVRLSRGDTLKIEVKLVPITGRPLPSYVTVSEKYNNERDFEEHNVGNVREGKYIFRLANVRSGLKYFVTAGDQDTRKYNVDVEDIPIVESFHLTLVYPSYTNKSAETLQENIGDFSALVGTLAEFTLRSNKDLKSAWLAVDSSNGGSAYGGDFTGPQSSHAPSAHNRTLTVSGESAAGSIVINRTMTYTLRLLDEDSLQNRDPIAYTIQAVSDDYPTCQITYPGKDVDLTRDMQLPLRIEIGDDYGFTKLLLEYKLISSKYVAADKNYHSFEIQLPTKGAGTQDISYTWDLNSLNLVPEDVISYHAKVYDNDFVSGPKATPSAEYQIRLPSLDEVFASADSEHSDLVSNAEKALDNSNDLRQQLEKLSNEMKTAAKQMTWEQQKKMQNTLQRYEDLEKKVDSLKNKVETMTQNMLENKILSPETLEKYLELQKALQEINSPEFKDALKKLEQAVQSLSPEEVRQAMQNFQVNEEQIRQSIERTLSLIKRVEIEQKFDEIQNRVEQMMAQQQNLQKSTDESDSTNSANKRNLSGDQKEIQKELSSTKDALSDLKDRMNEFAKDMPMEKMDQAIKKLEQSEVGQQMQNSSRQLSQGEFSQAQISQQEIDSTLKDFQKSLSEAQKEMLQNQAKETINAMRKAQQNLLEISKKQEELRNQSAQTMPNSAESRELAERQNELMQELNYTAQQMMQLSNKSFAVTPQMGRQIGQAYSQMQSAMNDLQARSGQSSASEPQSQAMGSMNQAVMSIQSTLQAMMNGQGAGGFMSLTQQLQQLAGEQEGLNAVTSKLGKGGTLSMAQQAEISRLAAEQEAIQKSLQQLAQEAQQSAEAGEQNHLLGNLDQLSKDMKSVVTDLQNNEITPETIQRQQKILSRMLDASRSINKRDYNNQRQSSPGQDVAGKSPAELNLSNSNSEQDQELMKLIRKNFPPEYQKIILRYYQLLNKMPE